MSGSGTTTALSTGFAASMRPIAPSATAAGVTSPAATRSRNATASSQPRSLVVTAKAYAICGRVSVRLFVRAEFWHAEGVSPRNCRIASVQPRGRDRGESRGSGRYRYMSRGVVTLTG